MKTLSTQSNKAGKLVQDYRQLIKLLFISQRMRLRKLVFIVGPARSGTTILYKTLLQHPQFRLHAKNISFALSESAAFVNPPDLLSAQPDTSKHGRQYCLHDQQYIAEFQTLMRWHQQYLQQKRQKFGHAAANTITADRAKKSPATATQTNCHDLLLRCYFHFALQARKASHLVEKTPRHILFINDILRVFPRARVVFIYRHPLDIYSSYRRRLHKELANHGENAPALQWLRITPAAFSERYRCNITAGLAALQQYPNQVTAVRYESLTREPEQTLRELCAGIGIKFDHRCINAAENKRSLSKVDPLLNQAIINTPSRWQDFLSLQEAAGIESKLEDVLEQLCYSRYTD